MSETRGRRRAVASGGEEGGVEGDWRGLRWKSSGDGV